MPAVTKPSTDKVAPTGRAVPIEMKTAVVESRFTPVADLLTHISGSRLVVGYYQQLLATNDHARPLDIELEPAQQQYRYIAQLETRQQGDWSQSPDDTSKEWEVTGETITYPGLVPQTGDMLVVDVGQGQWGIAAVLNATPLSIQKQTCHRVTFRVLRVMDNEWMANLKLKTIINTHFVMDFLRAGKNPYIVDEEHAQYRSLDQLFMTMVADYFRTFYSDVTQTLLMPGQPGGAYDPFLVKAVLSLLDTTQHPLLHRVSAHSLDINYAYSTTTVWDALLNVEASYLGLACHKVGLVTKNILKDRGVFGGAYWHQFSTIMYPYDDRIDADSQFARPVVADVLAPSSGGAPVSDIERMIINTAASVNMELVDEVTYTALPVPQIPRYQDREGLYYLFTEAFYSRDATQMSQLEVLVWSILDHNEVDIGKLYEMVDCSRRWDKLDRYYYVPVLIWMCVIAFRGPSHA